MEQLSGGVSSGESVKVFVRVRPPDPNLDSSLGQGACLEVTSDSTLTVYSKPEPKVFTFDHVADKNITQEDVFTSVGRPIIDSCMHGYNGTIFAYGQTGSGKTFTMMGPPSEDSDDTFTHELRGIIPRSFEYLFSFINRNKQKYGELVEFLCKCAFLEIYNEQVYDLLDPASTGLHLRENMKHGVYVDGLSEVGVVSAREAYQVLTTGWVNRKVASTSMNRESSRSHAVFTLSIESKKREGNDSVAKIRTSVLNLVDLAGSERQRDTQTAGLRLKEAGSINKSLSALGNVIMALVDIANGKSRHVHYRDSKLTFLLRDSLGGNAKTHLVANVHPSARCFGESLSTLNFARRAKMIRNKAVINEDASGNVMQLQAEIKRLRNMLDHFKSGSPTPSLLNTSSMMSPPSPTPSDNSRHAHQDKKVVELKTMLAASMEARDRANIEKTEMHDQVGRLKELIEKKDKFLQSTKMILKFRESHISNLEKVGKDNLGEEAVLQDDTNKLLREEVQQLKYLIEHHPDRVRLTHENQGLKAEIKKLKTCSSGKTAEGNHQKQLARSHQYTLQLERQLRHYLARGSVNGTSPISGGCLAPLSPAKLSLELEALQTRCRQLQEELDTSRRSLHSQREEAHFRESKLEASLATAKKTNAELQRSIEALKLKNSVEKATLNDIHMNTIKTILTPKRDREVLTRNRSFSVTPITSGMRRADSAPTEQHPLLHRVSTTTGDLYCGVSSPPGISSCKFPAILETSDTSLTKIHSDLASPLSLQDVSIGTGRNSTPNHIPSSTPLAKKARLSRETALSDSNPEKVIPNGSPVSKQLFSISRELDKDGLRKDDENKGAGSSVGDLDDEEMEVALDESRIQGALTEELQRLQDRNRRLEQELEELERRVVQLSHAKGALEAQLEEITQLSKMEREGYQEKEQSYLEKVSVMGIQIADLKSNNEVLESEVQDLRVCLKSADKELKEVRDEKREEKRSSDLKITNYIQKVGELERLYSVEESKYNRSVEELQNIQVETETLREELKFKEHRIEELEGVAKREKEHSSAQEGEMQSLLEKLAHEVETNTRLSHELQEGHSGKEELVSTMKENTSLRSELEKLEGELQTHLQDNKQHMEQAELALGSLLKKKAADEAAIAGLVSSIQELREEKARSECRLADLERELEESGREMAAAASSGEKLKVEMEDMKSRLKDREVDLNRVVFKNDAEREILLEDLDRMSDQYQKLSMRFEEQVRQLAAAQGGVEELRRELGTSENEVKRLLHEKVERKLSSPAGVATGADVTLEEEVQQLKRQLDQAAEMIESYEKSREEKNNEIIRLKDLAHQLEEAKEARDTQQGVVAELRYELNLRKEEEETLKGRVEVAVAEAEEKKVRSQLMESRLQKMSAENEHLNLKSRQFVEELAALKEQIERYRSTEESLFQEKESVRSQLEMLHEEKAKLSRECEKLVKENAAITGHQNIRQKIQYHAAVKIENAKLKEEVIQLHSRLRRKADQVDKLQTILTENGLEPYRSKYATKIQNDQENEFKENVRP